MKNFPAQKFCSFFLNILAISATCMAGSKVLAEETYILARAPQRAEVIIQRNWGPLTEYLTQETGKTFKLETFPSRTSFEGSLKDGTSDFAFMSPYYYTVARQLHGYIPLIRSDKQLQGILVVSKRAKINAIGDLDGQPIVFPSPNAFAASLLMRAQLTEKEKIDFIPMYVETHDNVYRNVIFGNAVAGGGVMRTLNQESDKLKQQLRVIYKTPVSAPHPLSAHPRVPSEVREAVITAMLKLQTTERGRQLLKKIKIQKPIRAEHQRDYSVLDELGLDKYGTLSR